MSIFSVLGSVVKHKVLVTTLIAAASLTTIGTALAATSGGQDVLRGLAGVHATVTATSDTDATKASATANACKGDEDSGDNEADSDKDTNDGKVTATAVPSATPCKENDEGDASSCPGQPEAQQLATKFSLSTDSKSSSMQVICTLHDGTFQGTNHALGYGEIDQLLALAQSLAKKANTTLSDSNVQTYVATALKNCGSTAIEVCVNTNMPDSHSNGSNNSSGHDSGKPTVTPVPTPHGDGKPAVTPTPHTN